MSHKVRQSLFYKMADLLNGCTHFHSCLCFLRCILWYQRSRIRTPEFAMIRFDLQDRPEGGGKYMSLGHSIVPLTELRVGYRYVSLQVIHSSVCQEYGLNLSQNRAFTPISGSHISIYSMTEEIKEEVDPDAIRGPPSPASRRVRIFLDMRFVFEAEIIRIQTEASKQAPRKR